MPEILTPLHLEEKRSLISFPDSAAMYRFADYHMHIWRQVEFGRCWSSVEDASKHYYNPHRFLREFLWCVYVSGFKAQTISKKYDALLKAHYIEDAAGEFIPLVERDNTKLFHMIAFIENRNPFDDVLKIFNNVRKAEYVQRVRNEIVEIGWSDFYEEYVKGAEPAKLRKLDGIGPALSCHLARNLGNQNVCKPDVHLNRLAAHYGYDSVQALCSDVSKQPVGKTDLILWLASVDNGTT